MTTDLFVQLAIATGIGLIGAGGAIIAFSFRRFLSSHDEAVEDLRKGSEHALIDPWGALP